MNLEKALSFLKECELYFQKRSIMSNEESEVQAYNQNAFNINKIIKLLEENKDWINE